MSQTIDTANQRNRRLGLLKNQSPDWVLVSEVVTIAGFEYNARIFESRRLEHRIENDPGGAFRLVTHLLAVPVDQPLPQQQLISASKPKSVFGDLQPQTSYPD